MENLNNPAESSHLVKTLLERRRLTVIKDLEMEDHMRDSSWVASKDFTVEVGKEQIAEHIRTWELKPCWHYGLDFLYSTEEEHHTFYHYRARFSTPTQQRPIQGTASVYFVADISKVRPQSQPVEIHYVVESNRLVHTPGRTRFREKWLADVIESKTALRVAVDL